MCGHGSDCTQRRSSAVVCLYCEEHRCQTEGEPCAASRAAGSDFCSRHSCRACVFMHRQAGALILQARGQACRQHTCTMLDCVNIMFGPGVAFCLQHSCGEI
jgi:hypothetical protein